MASTARTYIWFLLAVAVAALAPLVMRGEYTFGLATEIGINAIVVLGLSLLMGYAGQISLGQAAFVGIGAYASAILTAKLQLPPWMGLGAGVTLSALTAAAVGVPLLKLKGHYLAMGTLGFGLIVHTVMVQWDGLTGSTTGISDIPPLALAGFEFEGHLIYYPVAASLLLALLLASNIIRSRAGRAMMAVHGSEQAAEVSGVDTARYKLQVFVLSGALAGLAGGLYAHHASYIVCDTFGFHYSIQLVIMTVIGGMANIWGAVLGAAAVMLVAEHLRAYQEFSSMIFGGVLVTAMIFCPQGIWRAAGQALQRASQLTRRLRFGARQAG